MGARHGEGQPYEGWASIRDSEKRVGAVYELSRGGEVAFSREGENVKGPVKFDTNDGRMFVFLAKKIGSVALDVPSGVENRGVCPWRTGEKMQLSSEGTFDGDRPPQFALNIGVANHPGDLGMRRLADLSLPVLTSRR